MFHAFMVIIAIGILLIPQTVFPHALHPESIDRCAELILTPSKLVLIYQVILGVNPTERASKRLDANNDGEITDLERNKFLKAFASEYAAKQTLQIDAQQMKLQYQLGDTYSTIGHNGINVLRVDIGYSTALPADLPRNETLPFSYSDKNLVDIPGWKQIRFTPRDGVRFEGHIPYEQYKPFDYEIINTKGFYPSTDNLNLTVNIPPPIADSEMVVSLPERVNILQEETTSLWETIVLSGVLLFVIAVGIAVYLRFRQSA